MAPRFDIAIGSTEGALRQSPRMRTWLGSLRWCGDAIRPTADVAVKDRALVAESGSEAIVIFLLSVTDRKHGARAVHLPLSIASARLDPSAFELQADGDRFYVAEGEPRGSYARFVVDAFRRGAKIHTASGDLLTFRGAPIGTFRQVTRLSASDTSNILLRITTSSGELVLKSYKLLDAGNREPEILTRLRARGFPHAVSYLGEMVLGRGDDRLVLGILTEHLDAVDLFTSIRNAWRQAFAGGGTQIEELVRGSGGIASDLGEATASLHEALVDGHPGPWEAEEFTQGDFRVALKTATQFLGDALRRLSQLSRAPETRSTETVREARTRLLDLRSPIEDTLRHLEANVGGVKTVIHSDLHLGQVLRRSSDGELLFIDFEGEPARTPGARGKKLPPLRDVGAMVRSFAYARHYATRDLVDDASGFAAPMSEAYGVPVLDRPVRDTLIAWEAEMVERYIGAYLSRSTLYLGLSRTDVDHLVRAWAMEKALYELNYELLHRVENVPIPLDGIASLASPAPTAPDDRQAASR